ncbi:uncharacterized protein LOC108680383 [Hyalella azteca]|uniref:Uncharacterized protein LOC108680383 n=1 Tax=Hyalella azteca TaxID=294128 RepID=A0A8B7PH86_HYAAZ|nr:uncharacterized protein LOC108680383 [Hyalella azteca]
MASLKRSAIGSRLSVTLFILLTFHQISGQPTDGDEKASDTEGSSGRGLWESDIFFIQKLASFFGGGDKDTKTTKTEEPIRRQDRVPVLRHQMVPPQLFHPENIETPNGPLTVVSHSSRPAAKFRVGKNPHGVRQRPRFPLRQKNKLIKVPPPMRKTGEKLPVLLNQSEKPSRLYTGNANFVQPENFRVPPPLSNSLDGHRTHANLNTIVHSQFSQAPYPFRMITSPKPFVNPFQLGFTDPHPETFTRTVTSSLLANHNPTNPKFLSSPVAIKNPVPNLAHPRDSSFVFPSSSTQKNLFFDQSSLLQPSGSVQEVTRVKQPQFLSGLSFNSIGTSSLDKPLNRFRDQHLRPPPQPQRVELDLHKPNPFDSHAELHGLHKTNELGKNKFEYNGSDDFLPSPKEGNMLEDAFQPIFRASQSLDMELPESFMKPMHIASARSLTFAQPAPPPEVIDFFEEDGMKHL